MAHYDKALQSSNYYGYVECRFAWDAIILRLWLFLVEGSLIFSRGSKMNSFLVQNARIFTGEDVLESGNVLVEKGIITYVGSETPKNTDVSTIVSGSGSTLMPGIIDAHIHANKGRVLALEQSLRFGVTTVCDMHNEPPNVAKLKKIARERNDVADFKSACLGATIEEGWPVPIVTLHDKSEEVGEFRLSKWVSE